VLGEREEDRSVITPHRLILSGSLPCCQRGEGGKEREKRGAAAGNDFSFSCSGMRQYE